MTTPYIPPVAVPKTRELMETLGWLKVSSKKDALEKWIIDRWVSDVDRATYRWLVAQPSADPHHWWDVRVIVLEDFPLLEQEDYDSGVWFNVVLQCAVDATHQAEVLAEQLMRLTANISYTE